MAQKIQFKITNIKFAAEAKNIERHLKTEFQNLYKNFYTQKDKKHNVTVHFSFKNDELLMKKLTDFFEKTYWKLSRT
jgi:hypothetical protein